MLTDDDLTRQLGAAFRATSDDLTYTGRVPTARRTPSTRWLAVPAVAAAAALVVIPNAGDGGDGGGASETPHAAPSTTPDASPAMVTETIRVAGYTLTYEREAGAPRSVYFIIGGEMKVPDDFREVELDGPVRGWAGVDAASGDARVYTWHPADEEGPGGVTAITSPTWTQDQLIAMLREGIAND